MNISVTSSADRPSREQQIQELFDLVPPTGLVKLRFPVQMYDEASKQYATLREAQWTLSIPKATMTTARVTDVLEMMDLVLRTVGMHGVDYVKACLDQEIPSPREAPPV